MTNKRIKNVETRFVAMATNISNETILNFVKKHTTEKSSSVSLNKYVFDYFNEEDGDLFRGLVCSTVDIGLYAKIDTDGNVTVCDLYDNFFASYSDDYPVVDVYKDLTAKMTIIVKLCIKRVKEEYAKNKELRIPAKERTFIALRNFGNDFGIEYTEGWDKNLNAPYFDIIGINE